MLAQRLQYGDAIGIVSPCHAASEERYAPFIAGLRALGFSVKTGHNLYKATYGYAASEKERAEDFHQMFLDDDVKMILFGGGSGGNEVLPYLDFSLAQSHSKLIVSYSDGTTLLNAFYAKTGLIPYYGQTPGIFGNLSAYDTEQFMSHLVWNNAKALVPGGPWRKIYPGVSEGILLGGYVANFAMLLGSCYFPYNKNQRYILFLEDHEKFSTPAEVSASLAHIEQSGMMEHVTGLLFGHYSVNPCQELEMRLARLGAKYHIPIAWCDDFGHGERHALLPIGQAARLDADALSLRYLVS